MVDPDTAELVVVEKDPVEEIHVEAPAVPLEAFRFSQKKVKAYALELAERYGEEKVVAGLLADEDLDPVKGAGKVRKPTLEDLEAVLEVDRKEKDTRGGDE